ncbi:MAG: SDR family oxidoreductase [Acidimicrobiales bacterium]
MILDRFRMDDKVAIVTGAGRGIGAATAVALAEAGADVVISARTEEQLHTVAAAIEAAGRTSVIATADLSDLEAVAGLVDYAREAFGRLDLVVNNVGGAMPRPFLDTSPGRLEQAFHFNVATAHALLRPAVPLMIEHGSGCAVNISSAMGRLAGRGYLAYGTAKAAMAHYTRLAAADLAPRIRVNAIAVGSVATSALDFVTHSDELRNALQTRTPLGRIGDPEDVASAVIYLASAAGSYVTGKVIEVDGGIEQPNLEIGIPDV